MHKTRKAKQHHSWRQSTVTGKFLNNNPSRVHCTYTETCMGRGRLGVNLLRELYGTGISFEGPQAKLVVSLPGGCRPGSWLAGLCGCVSFSTRLYSWIPAIVGVVGSVTASGSWCRQRTSLSKGSISPCLWSAPLTCMLIHCPVPISACSQAAAGFQGLSGSASVPQVGSVLAVIFCVRDDPRG